MSIQKIAKIIIRSTKLNGVLVITIVFCLIGINAYAADNPLAGKWELISSSNSIGEVVDEPFNYIEILSDGRVICQKNGRTIFEARCTVKGDTWVIFEVSEEVKQKLVKQAGGGQYATAELQQMQEVNHPLAQFISGMAARMDAAWQNSTIGYLFNGKPKQFMLSLGEKELTIIGENYVTGDEYGNSIPISISWEFVRGASVPSVSTSSKIIANVNMRNNELAAEAALKTIAAACIIYRSISNGYPANLQILVDDGYLEPDFPKSQKDGYTFTYERNNDSFRCVARPIQKGFTGNKVFLITDSGEVTEVKE